VGFPHATLALLTDHFHIEEQTAESKGNNADIGCTVIECDEIFGLERWDKPRSVG